MRPLTILAALWLPKEGVERLAALLHRNEVAGWLRSLEWDGRRRLDRVFPVGFGSPSADAGLTGVLWMRSAVARALNPGCQVQSLVLFGPQGCGKSSGLCALVGPRLLCTDGQQDGWVYEMPGPPDKFLRYPPWSVVVFTCNISLDDTESRRFRVCEAGRVDLGWLERNREQLWAEAVADIQAGAPWWQA